LELVREFVRQEIGDKYTYTFAIHNPTAAIEGGEQPHAHIMFSERIIDGIDRPAEQYFKRWNAKNPERGGAKKGNNEFKTAVTRAAELVQLRERFANLQNKHLARHGHSVQVTHLSLTAQGIDREVEPHLGPKRIKELGGALKIDRETAQIDRTALKTPDAPEPTPEEKQAAVELYKHFKIALETGEKDRKRAYGDSVANIKAAEDARAKYRGIRDSVDADFAKLGKRPMLLAGKWDAEKARLSAVYFAAKTEEAKAQERKQEHTKQAEKYGNEPSINDQVNAAFKALNLPPNAQTFERLQLGEQVFKEHQQEQAQARAMQREQERAQPKPAQVVRR
jgi:hypothetical protein